MVGHGLRDGVTVRRGRGAHGHAVENWKCEPAEEVSLTAEGVAASARCLPTFKLRFGGKAATLRPRARLTSFARPSFLHPFLLTLFLPGFTHVFAAFVSFLESLFRERQDQTGARACLSIDFGFRLECGFIAASDDFYIRAILFSSCGLTMYIRPPRFSQSCACHH